MKRNTWAAILRWVARVWSVAAVGLLCAFLFGEGLPPLTVRSVLFPFGVMLGLILAWWFERIGGLLAAVCMLLFYALHYLSCDGFPKGYAFLLVSAPSVVFLLSGFLRAAAKDTGVGPQPLDESAGTARR